MEAPQILDQKHPSFGTPQAWFQFAIQADDGAFRKLLLVEAKNPAAVATIERILLVDGKVSDKCSILAVYRDCPSIGMRSELVEEAAYVDFMLDVVDADRLLADTVISTYFSQSLTDEDRAYAQAKARAQSTWVPTKAPSRPAPKKTSSPTSERKTTLLGALVGMGFHKSEVQKWIDANDVESGDVKDQIRAALLALAS